MNRPQSSHTFGSPSKSGRPQSSDDAKENMWSALLDSVASGKRLPEKNVIVLGGSQETQRDFLETLDSENTRRPQERFRKKPPVANEFALGYTYQDVLDADQEDILARLSIHTLQRPSLSFAPLLKPLLSPQTIPETLLVILLDWAEPWSWVRQLREWITILHEVLSNLDNESKSVMQEIVQEWEQRRRGGAHDGGSGAISAESNVNIPLGPGEWDESLGLPLCVVCHNSNKIDLLENEYSWREEEFDYVLQFLRTILLKHGASLVYTSNTVPNSLPTLVQSSLGIHSLLKRQPLKHNVIDRDKILIPPNWDSWGKIRVLREGFDVEGVSESWGLDIQPPKHVSTISDVTHNETTEANSPYGAGEAMPRENTVRAYEEIIQNPKSSGNVADALRKPNGLEFETTSMQDFLASQSEVMEKLKVDEAAPDAESRDGNSGVSYNKAKDLDHEVQETGRVNEHIGPVQFNMGGIQVDAEDMLKRLKDREREDTPDRETAPPAVSTPDGNGKQHNEALASFFAGLIKRGGANSPKPTPR